MCKTVCTYESGAANKKYNYFYCRSDLYISYIMVLKLYFSRTIPTLIKTACSVKTFRKGQVKYHK